MKKKVTTPIVLCADDFGLSAGVCRGIVELVDKRRLSAVGCMTTGSSLPEYAGQLGRNFDRVDIGLHMVLTDLKRPGAETALAPGGRFHPMAELMKRAFLHQLPKADIVTELTRQWDTFMDIFGRSPDFVDGHHHIHQLPVIREVVLELAVKKLHDHQPWLRSTAEKWPLILHRGINPLKAMQLSLLGGAFRRRAERRGLRVNSGFSGVYDFSSDVPYARLFERFVNGASSGTLIMCHPGHVDDELRGLDGLTDLREAELSYFLGDEFLGLLEKRNLRLVRFAGE